MSQAVRLQVVIPFHEPLTRREDELERRWDELYTPLLTALEAAGIAVALHFTGHLLDHLARRREEILLRLKRIAQAKRVELLGGLFSGGLPELLPDADVRGQVQMMAEYWESLLGTPPRGFWLPELAWTPELPRLLADTGLAYGFVGSSQLTGVAPAPVAVIERAEQRIAAFVLDSALSTRFAVSAPTAVVEGVTAAAGVHRLVSLWVPAERLAAASAQGRDWLDGFAAAAAGRLDLVLPAQSFDEHLPAAPARLIAGVAPELWPAEPRPSFADLPHQHVALDVLQRRMLRASIKLSEAIAVMEDEELEDTWSDALATAQRLIFAAQAPDAYLRAAGDEGRQLRAAAMAKLIRAEVYIDTLVQGEDDWIATEEEDLDGDLLDETFVCNRHLTAWIMPAAGGRVLALDDRHGGRTLLEADAGRQSSRPARARAVGDHVLATETAATAIFEGTAESLLAAPPSWRVRENQIREQEDFAYHLEIEGEALLTGAGDRRLTVHKELVIPIDAAEVRLAYAAELHGAPGILLVTEIPVRLPAAPTAILANGDPLEPGALELTDVESLRIETGQGALELTFEPAAEVWCTLTGESIVVAPVLRIEGRATGNVGIQWSPPPGSSVDVGAAVDERERDGGDAGEGDSGGDGELDERLEGGSDRAGEDEPVGEDESGRDR